VTGPMMAERDVLKSRLEEAESSLRDVTSQLENMAEERNQLQYQVKRLDEKLVSKDRCALAPIG
jgi:predicted nuclease with TOPRIM domain